MRLLATALLIVWLAGGLFLTLQPAHPFPGQVVDDNSVPFHTIAIYGRNLGSWFWMRNALDNLGLLFPLGLLGRSPSPPWTDGGEPRCSHSRTQPRSRSASSGSPIAQPMLTTCW